MTNASQNPKSRRLWIGTIAVVILLVAATSMAVFIQNWKEKAKVAHCRMNLRNYNSAIAGANCMSTAPTETWKDPDAVVELIKDKFQMSLPTCPDGGVYSLIHEANTPNLPTLVCSKEKSHGHGPSNN